MSTHTLANLRDDVEDMAAKHGFGELMEAHFATAPLGLEHAAFSLQRLKPGVRQPFAHRHSEQAEVYVILSGSGRVRIDDEILGLRAFDAVRLAPEAIRCFEAGDDGLEFLAFGAPRLEDPADEAEQLPGWWG